ncbi:MAG: hypothetical protein AABW83_01210 [Nanoarchaeota archaeon]
MSYNLGLNSKDRNKALCDYLCQRLGEYKKIGGERFLEINFSENELMLSTPSKNHIDIIPEFYKGYLSDADALVVNITTSSNDDKLIRYLKEYVENDSIFAKGKPLYSERREKELPKWQETLERISASKESKLISIIKDETVSTSRLKNTFFEYMVRPLLFFLIHEKKLFIQ